MVSKIEETRCTLEATHVGAADDGVPSADAVLISSEVCCDIAAAGEGVVAPAEENNEVVLAGDGVTSTDHIEISLDGDGVAPEHAAASDEIVMSFDDLVTAPVEAGAEDEFESW